VGLAAGEGEPPGDGDAEGEGESETAGEGEADGEPDVAGVGCADAGGDGEAVPAGRGRAVAGAAGGCGVPDAATIGGCTTGAPAHAAPIATAPMIPIRAPRLPISPLVPARAAEARDPRPSLVPPPRPIHHGRWPRGVPGRVRRSGMPERDWRPSDAAERTRRERAQTNDLPGAKPADLDKDAIFTSEEAVAYDRGVVAGSDPAKDSWSPHADKVPDYDLDARSEEEYGSTDG
jgi:hypothetical protein